MDTEADRRQTQIGLNETSYRRVNEGIVLGSDTAADLTVLCECGRLGCNARLMIAGAEYEAVRAHALRFVIVPGHELLEAEDVIERREQYWVVEKKDNAAEVAEQTDPRAPIDPV